MVRVGVRFIFYYSELASFDPRSKVLQTLLGRKKHEEEMSYESGPSHILSH